MFYNLLKRTNFPSKFDLCYWNPCLHQSIDTKPYVVCTSATKQRVFGKTVNYLNKRDYHLSREINDTYDSETEENNLYDSIIIEKLSEMQH